MEIIFSDSPILAGLQNMVYCGWMDICVKVISNVLLTFNNISYLQISFIFQESTYEVGFSSFGHVTVWKNEHNSYP